MIVDDDLQVNPDNSRAMSELTFLLFKLNTLQKEPRQSLSEPKLWCNDSSYTAIMTSRRLIHHNPISRGTI